MQNLSYENEFDLHENGRAVKTHFHFKVSHENSFFSKRLLYRAHSFAAYAYTRRICPLEYFIVF